MDEAITKSSTGLDGNIAGALCYALSWVTGIIFLVIEKDSKFVRFHAMQSLLFSVGLFIIYFVLGRIPVVGWILSLVVALGAFVLWLLLMYNAYQGKMFKLPVIGDIAAKQMDR